MENGHGQAPLTEEALRAVSWQRRIMMGRKQKDDIFARMALDKSPDQGFQRLNQATLAPEGPRQVDKRNHLTLVQTEYLYQIGLLPRNAWEAYTFLYSEAIELGWADLIRYYDNLIQNSQSVDGFRSKQLVEAMAGDREKKQSGAGQLQAGERATTGLRAN